MNRWNKDFGKRGEDLASEYLKDRGYKILQKNFKSKTGEIDIVALEKDVLVFIEVKTRYNQKFGLPEEAVTPWKINKIVRTGDYYRMLHPKSPEGLRIDIVSILMSPAGEAEEIRLIKNATG